MRVLRWLFLSFLFLLICALLVIVFIVRPYAESKLVPEYINEQARKNNQPFSIQKASIGLTGVTIHGVSTSVPLGRFPFPLQFEHVGVYPNWLKIGQPSVVIPFDSSLYGGTISGNVGVDKNSSSRSLTVNAKNIQLASHPLLKSIGISNGTMSFALTEVIQVKDEVTSASITFSLSDFKKPTPVKIPFGTLKGLTFPAIPEASVTFESKLSMTDLDVKVFALNSSLGTITAKGAILRKSGTEATLDGDALRGRVHLSSQGSSLLGIFLPFISKGAVKTESTDFDFIVSGSLERLQWAVTVP